MTVRDNCEDYLERGQAQVWIALDAVECPPSFEVFEYGWEQANHERAHITPLAYANHLAGKYQRADTGMFTCGEGEAMSTFRKPWWRFNNLDGRLVST